MERVLSSEEFSNSTVPADECSPTYAAGKTLCDLATYSSENGVGATVKLLKKPSQRSMRACKSKESNKWDKLFLESKSTLRPHSLVTIGGDGFPTKKPRRSKNVRDTYVGRTNAVKRGTLHWSAAQSVTSPPRKLFRDSNPRTGSHGTNHVNKSYDVKLPRGEDRPSSSQQKLGKVVPVKWSRPIGQLESPEVNIEAP